MSDEDWFRQIMPHFNGINKVGLELLSELGIVYCYLILMSQAAARSRITGNDA